jgi:F-type H+-transporting ATPase subunit a
MAHDPILHIKDSIYFEVPRALWWPYKSLESVPAWLREAHEHATLEDFNRDLAGKYIIPQPFGTPKNLYEPASGILISKFMVIETVVAILMIVIFTTIARRVRSGHIPRGRFWNFFEVIMVYLRDNVIRAAIGGGHDESHGHDSHGHDTPGHGAPGHGAHAEAAHGKAAHPAEHAGHGAKAHAQASPYADADRFVPLLWTMFFFILFLNLMGILPWLGAPTGEWGVTLALACITLLTVFVAGFIKFGPIGFGLNQVPSMQLPILFIWLKPAIWAIEVLGIFIRHAVLSIRLLANMVAGHLVLLGILGLILVVANEGTALFATVAGISVLGTTALTFLELFVAFLQAYIFTFLSALFIGAAIHSH